MRAQQRETDYVALSADSDAVYDKTIEIDLSELRPLVACPHSPDNVKAVSDVNDLKIDQFISAAVPIHPYLICIKWPIF